MATQSNPRPEGIALKNLEILVENVQEDTELTPQEKETIIRWPKSGELAHVLTEEAGLIRRFLRLPHFEGEEIRTLTDSGQWKWVSVTDYTSGPITGLKGQVPVQALKVQSACRTQPAHCHVVSADGLVDI